MKFGFAHIPPETVVGILQWTTFRDILTCQTVCKTLNDIIKSSMRLQYLVELAVAGYVDNPDSSFTTEQRLAALKTKQAAWKLSKHSPGRTIPISEPAVRALYSGSLFVRKFSDGTSSRIEVTDLAAQGRENSSWTLPFTNLYALWAVDAVQDLLVLGLRRSPLDHLVFDVRSLRDGSPHPKASSGSINLSFPSLGHIYSRDAVILGDTVAFKMITLSQDPRTADVILLNWKTGRLKARLQDAGLSENLFHSLISTNRFLICSGDSMDGFNISVYSVTDSPTSHEDLCPFPRLLGIYELPRLQEGVIIHGFDFSEFLIAEGQFAHPKPFSVAIDNRLLLVTLRGARITGTPVYCCLYVLASTFLSLDNAGCHPILFPWNDWGPASTHCKFREPDRDFSPKLHGFRTMFGHELMDFNPLDVARDLQRGGGREELEPNPLVAASRIVKVAETEAGYIFAENIKWMLPYRSITYNEHPPFNGILSDDFLVNVEASEDLFTIQSIHIFPV